MKHFANLILLALSFLFYSTENLWSQCAPEPFALIELFSSEGCSSCPPADEQFNKMVLELGDMNILMIDYHVDYWNGSLHGPCGHSAWVDPYSISKNTDIQSEYRNALNGKHLVTPQFVVNGAHATSIDIPFSFDPVKKLAKKSLRQESNVGVCLKLEEMNKEHNQISISYEISGVEVNSSQSIVFVLYENGIEIEVTAGENCGKQLKHEAVSRFYLRKLIANADGQMGRAVLEIPQGLVLSNAGVLAYIQDNKSKKVVGGTRGVTFK